MFSHAEEKNPFYIDTRSRFVIASPEVTPLLFTTAMSFCVSIGLIYKVQGTIKKIALYHSYSEHNDCEDEAVIKALQQPEHMVFQQCLHGRPDNLILAIKHFLLHVEDPANVKVIVAVNSEYSEIANDISHPEKSLSYRYVKRLVNRVCRILGKDAVTDFEYFRGGFNFFLLNDGRYLSTPIYCNTIENQTLAKHIARFLVTKIHKPMSHLDKIILAEFNKANHHQCTWVNCCQRIYTEILKQRKMSQSFFWRSPQRETKLKQFLAFLQAVCDPEEKVKIRSCPSFF